MTQPISFVDSAMQNHVCPLHKSLYSLKQAPQAWYTCLSDFLQIICFQASKVDNILLSGNNFALIHRLITLLSSEFKLCDLGNAHYFLGVEVTPTNVGIMLS